jgi:hypothetical protein
METGTLLKHGTDRKENFGNTIFLILKTAIKSFESRRFFWVGRLTANKQYFNLGLIHVISIHKRFSKHLMVMYGTWSFKMRLLTFALNALWEEACSIQNGSSFHSIGPEYVKVLVQSTELPSTSPLGGQRWGL